MTTEREVLPIFAVLRLIRDARSTRNSDRQLLIALGMRCNPRKKYLSWPSYRVLALDTLLDEVTLKRAAQRLEKNQLVKRVVRKNRSNCFYINVRLLQEQAAAVKSAELAAREAAEGDDSPFPPPNPENSFLVEAKGLEGDWLTGGAR